MIHWGQSAMEKPFLLSESRRAQKAWSGDFILWSGNFLLLLLQSLNSILTYTYACVFLFYVFAVLYTQKAIWFFPAWGNPIYPLNLTTSVEPPLIFLVKINLFFFQLLIILWVFLRKFMPLCLFIYMNISFINSTIKQCLFVAGTRYTGFSRRTCIPVQTQSWVEYPPFIGLGASWRQELVLLLTQGLAPKGTQKLFKLKLSTKHWENGVRVFKRVKS